MRGDVRSNWKYVSSFLALVLVFQSFPLSATMLKEKEAVDFKKWEELSSKQQELLTGYFKVVDSQAAATEWITLIKEHSQQAATFLAITNALSRTTLFLSGNKMINALDMMETVTDITRFRINGKVNRAAFIQWKDAGRGEFNIERADGKTEKGHVNFYGAGRVHKGYEMQGHTSLTKVPRIQWNYRDTDSAAEIDLDGYPVLRLGFIPGFRHFLDDNSNVLRWYKKYVKKFGHPGFDVRKTA